MRNNPIGIKSDYLSFNLKVEGCSNDWILRSIKLSIANNIKLSDPSGVPVSFFAHYSYLPRRPHVVFRRKLNILLLTHLDNSKYSPSSLYMKSLSFYDVIVCMNRSTAEHIRPHLRCGIFRKKPRIVINRCAGVSKSLFDNRIVPENITSKIPKGAKVVGYHCRPYKRKRPELLTEAMLGLDNCILLCCGNGHKELAVYNQLRRENRIIFIEPDIDEIWMFYKLIDTLVCTSEVEGGPTPLIEANSLGIPFISTDVGFAKEIATAYDKIVDISISAEGLARVIKDSLDKPKIKPKKITTWEDTSWQLYRSLYYLFK